MIKFYKMSVVALFAFGLSNAQSSYDGVISDYLNQKRVSGVSNSDSQQFRIINEDRSKSLGATILQVQQTYDGIPIVGAVASAVVKDNKVLHFTENFVSDIRLVSKDSKLIKNQKNVFEKVLKGLEHPIVDAKALDYKTVYYNTDNGLVLCYEYQIEDKAGNLWLIFADANTGAIIQKDNLTLSCDFEPGMYGRAHSEHRPFVGPLQQSLVPKANMVSSYNASYNVFALPVEAPTFGNRSLVNNPWDITVSPQGWHSDGENSYTNTRGNNVYAYTDLEGNNSIGYSPNGGVSRVFDYPLDVNTHHSNYQDAAVTNLFYMNNMMHDISYKFGFTEEARNFQAKNFTGAGEGKDEVRAEARDGIDKSNPNLNNANFATPGDGYNPRMQMYLWDPIKVERVFFNSPSEFTNYRPNSKTASFGSSLTSSGITGELIATTPVEGCEAIAEDLTNKIAYISRGTCNFTTKVKNAQDKGALAVIVYNVPSRDFGGMGGSDSSITIPSIIVDSDDGELIKNKLATSTVNVTLKDDPSSYVYMDASLDNGIIAHEYTHGISNRLTGDGYRCLRDSQANEQMGEGWSDFLALMLTNRPGDNASVPRGVGTFASGESTSGRGIRPAKYSPDFTINDYTYGKTNGMYSKDSNGKMKPKVHSIGFVWATILWDLHWKYAEKYGYASDVTANPNSGSARVLQLVMDGMKLQGCNPSFITGRDAIIQADQIKTGGADKCLIWSVFAKRGLGVNASSGLTKPKSSSDKDVKAALDDQTEDFTVPTECSMAVSDLKVSKVSHALYPNPAKDKLYLKVNQEVLGKLLVNIFDATGKVVLSQKVNPDDAIDVSKLVNGVYIISVEGVNVKFTDKVIINK